MKDKKFIYTILLGFLAFIIGCTPVSTEVTSSPVDTKPTSAAQVEFQFPPAEITNDEGGPVVITGEVEYTNPFFTLGVAEPVVILEDQTGFVDRDRDYIFPAESQVLGQITSDFYTSPFTYSLTLPLAPRGSLRDVDNDGETDSGVMVFAVAYWTNIWGEPFLERRDQFGGGWSSAYASTLVSDDRDNYLEVYGGKYIVYSPDSEQGFPSSFGADDLLFTDDDPIVQLPPGWTIVDLDSEPFVFNRTREVQIDLLEPESIALSDFSDLSYLEAFDAMLEKMENEYAFSEHKEVNWDDLDQQFRPRFESAEAQGNNLQYYLALRDFLWSIPDGHISMDLSLLTEQIQNEILGGLGMAIQELDDGRVLVNYLTQGGPADRAGILLGAEILEVNDKPMSDVVSETLPWSSPFSTEHTRRINQLIYALRFPLGQEVTIRYTNPDDSPASTKMITEYEIDSFFANAPFADLTGLELPVEFELLESGFGYVQITDFSDNELLTIQLWERAMQDLNEFGIPGLVIDLRQNGGGSGYLADQMAAYFYNEELVLGNTSYYEDSIDDFFADPGDENIFIPPREELQYNGEIVVIVGPACASACEFFAYNLTIQDRATIVGHYPTAGLGGSVEDFLMPEDISIRFTIGRAVDPEGNIHIEGRGVVPQILVPYTEDVFQADNFENVDVLLETAVDLLSGF
jgi:C-terminal processing protease CtpA/Prc